MKNEMSIANEGIEKYPINIEVEDKRNQLSDHKFNLSRFLSDMEIFMDPKKFSEKNKYKDFSDKYGKLSQFGTGESENFVADLQKSLAVKIVVEDIKKTINNRVLERTFVHLYMIFNEDLGIVRTLSFDKEGNFFNYSQAMAMKKDDIETIII